MTSRQESKISMYVTVDDVLVTNAPLVTPLPNYAVFSTAFHGGITQIQTNSEQQMFDKKGLSVNKAQLRNALVILALDTASKLQAYARFNNNQILISETKITLSDLKKLADTLLRDKAQGYHTLAQQNLAGLASYGINADSLTSLNNAIITYAASIPKPLVGTLDKKQNTLLIAKGFMDADSALENIDALIEIVKITQPNFYNIYKSARKILETGTGSLAVKGLVTEEGSGLPLKGVTLTFSITGQGANAAKPMLKKTADKGGFNVKSLPAGTYQVTVQKLGYAGQTVTIIVNDGEPVELNVSLGKS